MASLLLLSALWILPPAIVAVVLYQHYARKKILWAVVGILLTLFVVAGIARGGPWWCATLFGAGIALLIAEILIPGFSLAGVMGMLAVVAGWAMLSGGEYFILRLLITALPLTWLPFLKRKHDTPPPLPNRLVHSAANRAEEGYVAYVSHEGLLGQTGFSLTSLKPAGRADICGERVEVICPDGFVPAHTPVEVTHVSAARVEVRVLQVDRI
jgi:membrane-bound serine protease (ClpP class)